MKFLKAVYDFLVSWGEVMNQARMYRIKNNSSRYWYY
jgi:hypothetical protein